MKTMYKVNLETCIYVEADSEENAMRVSERYLNYAYDCGETDGDQWFHNTDFTSVEKVPDEIVARWNADRQIIDLEEVE
jgi:hypothetical protein